MTALQRREKIVFVLLSGLLLCSAAAYGMLIAGKAGGQTSAIVPTTTAAPPRTEDANGDQHLLTRPVEVADLSKATPVTSLGFTSLAGERRLVSARIIVEQPVTSSTRQTGVLLQVACADSADNRRITQSITNVERGSRVAQEPRLLFTASGAGQVLCQITARLYGEETEAGRTSRLVVVPGSFLRVSEVLEGWSAEWTWDYPRRQSYTSSLLAPGDAWKRVPDRELAVPVNQQFIEVQVDHKVTVCFWRGGSSDVTTPLIRGQKGTHVRENLCAANPLSPGAIVRSRVELTRLSENGRACATPVVAVDKRFWVGGRQHHARLNATAMVLLPTGPHCTERLRLRSWVENVVPDAGEGLDLVVHAPDERLAVLSVPGSN